MAGLALSRGRSHPAPHVRVAILALGTNRRDFSRTCSQAAQGRSEVPGSVFEVLRAGHMGPIYFLEFIGPDRRSGGAHRDAIHGELHRDATPGAGNAVSTSSAE